MVMSSRVAHYNRERIRRGATVDKAVVKKNLGRLTRKLSYGFFKIIIQFLILNRSVSQGRARKTTWLFEGWSLHQC